MGYFRICPYCGDYLDPGERCDCRSQQESQASGSQNKNAAPGAANTEGSKMENGLPTKISASIVAKIN